MLNSGTLVLAFGCSIASGEGIEGFGSSARLCWTCYDKGESLFSGSNALESYEQSLNECVALPFQY